MKVDIDYKFGQTVYLKNDIEQVEHRLNRIILEPKGRVCLEIMTPCGECFEIWEGHCLTEKDVLKATTGKSSDDVVD